MKDTWMVMAAAGAAWFAVGARATPPGSAPADVGRGIARQCHGSAGGGFSMTARGWVVFAFESRGDSANVEVLVVGRGQGRGRGGAARWGKPGPRPGSPVPENAVTGGSMGRNWVLYDRVARTLWVNRRAVPLGTNNLVLLDRADTDAPVVTRLLRIPPAFADPGACTVPKRRHDPEPALRAKLERVPEVMAFLRQP